LQTKTQILLTLHPTRLYFQLCWSIPMFH